MNKKRIGFLIMLLSILIGLGSLNSAQASMSLPRFTASQADMLTQPIQYTANNHIVGFLPHKIYLAGLDHMVSVEFLGTRGVEPHIAADAKFKLGEKLLPLSTVTYRDLWRGIDVTYTIAQDGITKSFYHVAPHADVAQIQLRYSAPIELERNGSLRIMFPKERGYFTESAPIAWQDIGNTRVGVAVSFKVENDVISFNVARHDSRYPLVIDPIYAWHTFYGPNDEQSDLFANAIAVAADGSVYIAGTAWKWQGDGVSPPLHPYTGKNDIVVLKLDSQGTYQWRTFYGSTESDYLKGIALDDNGNIYLTGGSDGGWLGDAGAEPIHDYSPHQHASTTDLFVLKLNPGGGYQWHTFYGSADLDFGSGIAVHGNDVYVAGFAGSTWLGDGDAAPLNPVLYTTVLKLDTNGVYQWHTFYGSSEGKVAVSENGFVYVAAAAGGDWSNYTLVEPLHSYSGPDDISVFKLSNDGAYQWHTFYGSPEYDDVAGVIVDANENVYINGWSDSEWLGDGNAQPLHAHTGTKDIAVLKLTPNGAYVWHTFYGGQEDDSSQGIAIDSGNNVYTIASSDAAWLGEGEREPLHGWSGKPDISILKLTELGRYGWHTFYGGTAVLGDAPGGIAIANDQSLYFAATSLSSWLGDDNTPPLHAFNTGFTAVALKMAFPSVLPSIPSLIKPTNKILVSKLRPNLDWTDTTGRLTYQIQLYQNERSGKRIVDTFVVNSTFKPPALVRGKRYFWRVRACNELGCSDWSRWWRFEVKLK